MHTKDKPCQLDPLKVEHVHPKKVEATAPIAQAPASTASQSNPAPKDEQEQAAQ